MTARVHYRYRALRSNGALELGALEATAREEVSRQLADQGLFVLDVMRDESGEHSPARLSWADTALGLRLLANLLAAGLAMDRALEAFDDSAPPGWRRLLPAIRESVAQGQSLGSAFAATQGAVPALVAGVVQAGEAGSGVKTAMMRAADLAESIAASSAAIRQALIYPSVLVGAGLVSLAFLTTVVLPRFAAILADIGRSPPVTTRLVLAAGVAARHGALPALLLLAIGFIAWRAWSSSARGRVPWHTALLAVPVLGQLRRSLATTNAAGVIGALLESGVPLPQALALGAAASGDAAAAAALMRSREQVLEGSRLSRAIEREGAFTPTAVRLTRVGEETGRLGSMLSEAGRIERQETERRVRALVQLIEPAFILSFGALVALVAAALLQALYGMRPV